MCYDEYIHGNDDDGSEEYERWLNRHDDPSPEQTANGEIPEEIRRWIETECPLWAKYDARCGHQAIWRKGALAMYHHLAPTIDQLQQKEKEVAEYRKALEEIENPIAAMQKRAKEQGYILDGRMAFQISEDHNYLKDIAKTALAKYPQNNSNQQ